MKELNEVVTDKIALMINDGTVEKIIAEKLERTITECIDSSLKTWSTFGKVLTKKIEESMQCASNDIKIPAYNQFIKNIVSEKFSQVLHEQAADHLSELINEIIEPIKKEARISELLNSVNEAWADYAIEQGNDEIKIDVDENSDRTALYVTFHHPEYDFYNVKVSFYNFKCNKEDLWHIGYINEDGKRITGEPCNRAKISGNNITDILFKYYAMGTKFELDTKIESIYIRD